MRALPSVTVKVIVLVPEVFGVGVSETTRFVPVPPSTTFASGSKAGLLEVLLTVSAAAAVCKSLTVNAKLDAEVSSLMLVSAILLMPGGAVNSAISAGVNTRSYSRTSSRLPV